MPMLELKPTHKVIAIYYASGRKAEIKSRVAANLVRWEKDHALFDRELGKGIRASRTDEVGREKGPSSESASAFLRASLDNLFVRKPKAKQ